MRTETGPRAEASRRTREAIVAATVRVVAHEGVAAVTHRRVAAEAGVALSSTTWHFATKADILEAALHWTARREVESIGAIAERLGGTDFDPSAWAEELGEWLVEQVTGEREIAVALYRLQVELLGSGGAFAGPPRVGRGPARGRRARARGLAHDDARARHPARGRRPRRPPDGCAQLGRAGRRVAATRRPPPAAGPARLIDESALMRALALLPFPVVGLAPHGCRGVGGRDAQGLDRRFGSRAARPRRAPLVRAAADDVVLVSRADGPGGASGNAASTLNNHRSARSRPTGRSPRSSRARPTSARKRPAATRRPSCARCRAARPCSPAAATARPAPRRTPAVSDVSMSDDGSRVAFDTRATNLTVPGEAGAGGVDRAFVRDRGNNTTTLVAGPTVSTARRRSPATASWSPFARRRTSRATRRAPGRRSTCTTSPCPGSYELVSRDNGASGPAFSGADTPSLSADGRYVPFVAAAQVYVRDRTTASTILVSRRTGENGEVASSGPVEPDISSDGRYVVFRTHATNLSDARRGHGGRHLRARHRRRHDDARQPRGRSRRAPGARPRPRCRACPLTAAGCSSCPAPTPLEPRQRQRHQRLRPRHRRRHHDAGLGRPGQDPAPQGVDLGAAISDDGRSPRRHRRDAAAGDRDRRGGRRVPARARLGAGPAAASAGLRRRQLRARRAGAGQVTAASFEVPLASRPSAQPVIVHWATGDGTAALRVSTTGRARARSRSSPGHYDRRGQRRRLLGDNAAGERRDVCRDAVRRARRDRSRAPRAPARSSTTTSSSARP